MKRTKRDNLMTSEKAMEGNDPSERLTKEQVAWIRKEDRFVV